MSKEFRKPPGAREVINKKVDWAAAFGAAALLGLLLYDRFSSPTEREGLVAPGFHRLDLQRCPGSVISQPAGEDFILVEGAGFSCPGEKTRRWADAELAPPPHYRDEDSQATFWQALREAGLTSNSDCEDEDNEGAFLITDSSEQIIAVGKRPDGEGGGDWVWMDKTGHLALAGAHYWRGGLWLTSPDVEQVYRQVPLEIGDAALCQQEADPSQQDAQEEIHSLRTR